MFLFSSACVDAIRVMTYMTKKNEGYVSADTISKDLGIVLPYLAKTLKKLSDAGLLESKRGVGGGVTLPKSPESIKLLEIILALDGEKPFDTCIMGLGECSAETPCALHERWEAQMAEFRELLLATTRAEVDSEIKRKKIIKL